MVLRPLLSIFSYSSTAVVWCKGVLCAEVSHHLLGNGTRSLDLIVALLVQVHTSSKAWKGTCCNTDHSFLSRVRRERRGQLPQRRTTQVWPTASSSSTSWRESAGQRSASGDTSERTSECYTPKETKPYNDSSNYSLSTSILLISCHPIPVTLFLPFPFLVVVAIAPSHRCSDGPANIQGHTPPKLHPFSLYGSHHKWLDSLPPFDGSSNKPARSLYKTSCSCKHCWPVVM